MDKVKIGYKEFEVIKTDAKQVLYENGSECIGQIYYDENKLYINGKFPQDTLKEAFIHEVVHGISYMFNVNLTEEQVMALGQGLYTVMRDNGYDLEDI